MRERIAGIVGCLLLASGLCRSAELEIAIHLFDYTGMETSASLDMRRTAANILDQVGISVQWRDCPVFPGAAGSGCGAGTYDVTHFVVAVLPENMSARIASSPQQFESVMGAKGGFPTHAYIFKDRVTDFAKADLLPWTSLLGAIVAHEIGHLLLGNDSHFGNGIMRGRWSLNDIKEARMGTLTFTARQGEQLRADVRRRMNAKD
jgi:hypothetical protein